MVAICLLCAGLCTPKSHFLLLLQWLLPIHSGSQQGNVGAVLNWYTHPLLSVIKGVKLL